MISYARSNRVQAMRRSLRTARRGMSIDPS
jgi:hypothetical protein